MPRPYNEKREKKGGIRREDTSGRSERRRPEMKKKGFDPVGPI
jgi:hypothetical protein